MLVLQKLESFSLDGGGTLPGEKLTHEGDTPTLWYAVFRGCLGGTHAVRKGSVCGTQKSCYIVRRHQFLLLKAPIFIKNTKKRDIQSQISLIFFARSLRSRCLGVIKAIINLNINFGRSKLGNLTLKHIKANV